MQEPISIQQAIIDKCTEHNLKLENLVKMMGLPVKGYGKIGLPNILKEGSEVSLKHIVMLATVFNNGYEYWINIQLNYQLYHLALDNNFCQRLEKLEVLENEQK